MGGIHGSPTASGHVGHGHAFGGAGGGGAASSSAPSPGYGPVQGPLEVGPSSPCHPGPMHNASAQVREKLMQQSMGPGAPQRGAGESIEQSTPPLRRAQTILPSTQEPVARPSGPDTSVEVSRLDDRGALTVAGGHQNQGLFEMKTVGPHRGTALQSQGEMRTMTAQHSGAAIQSQVEMGTITGQHAGATFQSQFEMRTTAPQHGAASARGMPGGPGSSGGGPIGASQPGGRPPGGGHDSIQNMVQRGVDSDDESLGAVRVAKLAAPAADAVSVASFSDEVAPITTASGNGSRWQSELTPGPGPPRAAPSEAFSIGGGGEAFGGPGDPSVSVLGERGCPVAPRGGVGGAWGATRRAPPSGGDPTSVSSDGGVGGAWGAPGAPPCGRGPSSVLSGGGGSGAWGATSPLGAGGSAAVSSGGSVGVGGAWGGPGGAPLGGGGGAPFGGVRHGPLPIETTIESMAPMDASGLADVIAFGSPTSISSISSPALNVQGFSGPKQTVAQSVGTGISGRSVNDKPIDDSIWEAESIDD